MAESSGDAGQFCSVGRGEQGYTASEARSTAPPNKKTLPAIMLNKCLAGSKMGLANASVFFCSSLHRLKMSKHF